MRSIGLRELRQNASEYVRRAEAGETIAITVSGREVAQLTPSPRQVWRSMKELPDALRHPLDDPDWEADMDAIDQTIYDPWERG